MSTWDGSERRKSKFNERDYLLIKIDANLENLLKEFESHKKDFAKHKDDDEDNFRIQSGYINALNIKMALAAGFIIAINFILRFIKI